MGTVAAVDSMVLAIESLGLEECATTNDATLRPPRVLSIVSSILERSIRRNEKLLVRASKMKDVETMFHGSDASMFTGVSIRRYLRQIFKYSSFTPSCFVVAYIYIERYLRRTDIPLTSRNVHRILLTSIVLAAKYTGDLDNNAFYAAPGGVSTTEMNKLELEFLFSLDFKLHVTTEMFGMYCRRLQNQKEGEEGVGRGGGGYVVLERSKFTTAEREYVRPWFN